MRKVRYALFVSAFLGYSIGILWACPTIYVRPLAICQIIGGLLIGGGIAYEDMKYLIRKGSKNEPR